MAMAIGPLVGLLSTGFSVFATIQQANNQAAMMEAQARFKDQEARDRAVAGGIEAERARRRHRLALSEQEASAAEAGVLSGSSLDLLDANSVSFELDALTLAYNRQLEGRSLESEATLLRADAGNVRRGGRFGAIGAGLSGVGRLIDGLNY